ncbi:MAG: DNA mismatch repair protein MutS [Anaeroplasma sp.]|uniref:DNA mismatch repair protein MutS n=1 Tax=Anaeroplasma sp. TaxID=1872523 RepID=UPI002A908891|nr:DNA mismatch repair protein MutS [Anaeroplasma sp.]MDY5982759.1 DNA mismatch repair protein MutS [Anaeroplasma sp.]
MAKAKSEKTVKYSPMMEQYFEIKKEYQDAIVFYRVGDFYEMFFDDAYTGSRELELALTGKDVGTEERAPMCGIPFHAKDQYIEKLVARGYKVAIAEQIEDPKQATGLVRRGVIRLITPGTIDTGLREKENNYIGAIGYQKREYILAYSDITTGDGYVATFKSFDLLANEILSLKIKEIIVNHTFNHIGLKDFIKNNELSLSYEDKMDIPPSLTHIVKEIDPMYQMVVGMLICYIIETQKQEPSYLKPFHSYVSEKYLHIDAFTKRNLEITETLRLSNKSGSLLWLMDKCNTAMGSRMLHKWVDKPLVDKNQINQRLDFVSAFNENYIIKEDIKASFKNVYDLERIITRISSGTANAKDLVWLRRSLKDIPTVKQNLCEMHIDSIKALSDEMDPHTDLYNLLFDALVENPPLSVKEGGMINPGYNKDLDELREISTNGRDWIMNYEADQRAKTGIKTLKVGYNRVTGYYIEISKGAIKDLPSDCPYERRATLVNSERFISPELKHYEQMVLGAKDQIESLEYEIFTKLRYEASKHVQSLQKLADLISEIDCYTALSDIAIKYNYVRPTFNDNRCVNIVDGRHPVLETLMTTDYIVNDVVINKYNMILITGPNMSGKSTYMRMLACIILMAQMGSFVPAKVADLMIFDSIFTRIGASDDLVSGQSTFMVEMIEANYAISNATKNSLVLFDEIGRGTATFDGMAIAQAILEYLHEKVGCITLFSTHYHELTSLDQKLKRLKNVHVEAKETENGVAFLHKVLDGPTDKSYGINVASLAGLPKSLTERSKQILNVLEEDSNSHKGITLDLFNFDAYDEKEEVKEESIASKIKNRLDEVDINKLTPLEALNILYELKEMS